MESQGFACRTTFDYETRPIDDSSDGSVVEAKERKSGRWYMIRKIALPEDLRERKLVETRRFTTLNFGNKFQQEKFSWIENSYCGPSVPYQSGRSGALKYSCTRTEIRQYGILSTFLSQKSDKTLNDRRRYAIELAEMLNFLHEKNISHGKLQQNRVLFDREDHIKIWDFSEHGERRNAADALDEEFETKKKEDVQLLRGLVIAILIPVARNPGDQSETYNTQSHNFIGQDITAPNFDRDTKSHILRLRELTHPEKNFSTARDVLETLKKNSIENNNTMSTPMDMERPREASSNTGLITAAGIGVGLLIYNAYKGGSSKGQPVKKKGRKERRRRTSGSRE